MKIYTRINGGLGNQLFSYALGYSVSKKTNSELIIDTSLNDSSIARPLEISNFNLLFDKRISFDHKSDILSRAIGNRIKRRLQIGVFTQIYKEKEEYTFDEKVYHVKKDTFFRGYWQSYKYLNGIETDIRKMIPIMPHDISKMGINEEDRETVAMHIRRGDYTGISEWTLPMTFYDVALEKIRKTMPVQRVYVFSDDISFCEQYFNNRYNDIEFIYPGKTAKGLIEEFKAMACFRNIIIANSTYSWWAAFLGEEDKKVYCPRYKQWGDEFYYPDWIKITV